jgi:hypothetical protein
MMGKSSKKCGVKKITQLEILNPLVAGIDVSDKEMMVAYPINETEVEIRSFACFTRDLGCTTKFPKPIKYLYRVH